MNLAQEKSGPKPKLKIWLERIVDEFSKIKSVWLKGLRNNLNHDYLLFDLYLRYHLLVLALHSAILKPLKPLHVRVSLHAEPTWVYLYCVFE